MKVLFLSAEAAPLVKVGGLADVAGELPRTLRSLGVDIRVALPIHGGLSPGSLDSKKLATVAVRRGGKEEESQVWGTEINGVPFYLLGGSPILRPGKVYTTPDQDGRKFTFFSLASLEACRALDWRPDILHANEWHSAASVVWLKHHRERDTFWEGVKTLFTVHNLPHLGAGSETSLQAYDLPPLKDARLPDWAQSLPLPMGLAAADWLSTVSPSYAEEIQTPAFGCGLEGFLQERRERLVGILNGIDPVHWDPASDEEITANFSTEDLEPRKTAKRDLLKEVGFDDEFHTPLLSMVTRLDHQKGVDVAMDALAALLDHPWRFVLLGTGDPGLEGAVRTMENSHPTRVRSIQRFDPGLARRIYAGADMVLIPSRYEPCGIVQLIALRYGCVPVATETGGLKDTLVDLDRSDDGTAFLFASPEPGDLRAALIRAMEAHANKRRWRAIQKRGMNSDFSWQGPGRQYSNLYRKIVGGTADGA